MADPKKFSPVRMSAKTEDAAVQQALMMTGASREDVTVDVLDRSETRVTVRVSPRSDDAPQAQAAPVEVAPAPVAEPEHESENIQPGDTLEASEITDMNLANGNDVTDENMPGALDLDEEREPELAAGATTRPPREPEIEAEPASEETRQRALELAQEMLDRMDLEATVRFTDAMDANARGATVSLEIEGEDVGILIGKHGATLQSFQYLLNLTLNNDVEGPGARVVVDAGGYRTRRASSIEGIARDAAVSAKRDGRSVRLEPMPAYERRLVHVALQGDTTITTSSEGAEPMRHVVVTPAGASRGFDRGGYGERGGSSGGGYAERGRGGFGNFGRGTGGGSGGGNRGGRGRNGR